MAVENDIFPNKKKRGALIVVLTALFIAILMFPLGLIHEAGHYLAFLILGEGEAEIILFTNDTLPWYAFGGVYITEVHFSETQWMFIDISGGIFHASISSVIAFAIARVEKPGRWIFVLTPLAFSFLLYSLADLHYAFMEPVFTGNGYAFTTTGIAILTLSVALYVILMIVLAKAYKEVMADFDVMFIQQL